MRLRLAAGLTLPEVGVGPRRYLGTLLRVLGWQPPGLCLGEILHLGGNLTRSRDIFGCQSRLNLVIWFLIISKKVKVIQNEVIEAVIVLLSFDFLFCFDRSVHALCEGRTLCCQYEPSLLGKWHSYVELYLPERTVFSSFGIRT